MNIYNYHQKFKEYEVRNKTTLPYKFEVALEIDGVAMSQITKKRL